MWAWPIIVAENVTYQHTLVPGYVAPASLSYYVALYVHATQLWWESYLSQLLCCTLCACDTVVAGKQLGVTRCKFACPRYPTHVTGTAA